MFPFPFKSMQISLSHNSITLGKFHKTSQQPFRTKWIPEYQELQCQSALSKIFWLFYFHRESIKSTSTRNWVVIKHRSYLLNEVILKNMVYCCVMQKHCSIRYIKKIYFLFISSGTHITFKPVKVMLLNCYFSYRPHPKKTRRRTAFTGFI